ncbi:hypothetical protein N200_05925 [Helicobacter pylori UM065]|nr:hypothetical protein N200_05925 [Helicobacter pylori UM065]
MRSYGMGFNKTRDLKSDKEFSKWWHSNPLKRVQEFISKRIRVFMFSYFKEFEMLKLLESF